MHVNDIIWCWDRTLVALFWGFVYEFLLRG